MYEPLAAEPLSAIDLAAMKLADSYSLHTHPHLKGSVLRVYIEGTRTTSGAMVFTTRQQELFPVTDVLPDQRAREIRVSATAHSYGFRRDGGWSWGPGSQESTPTCYFSGSTYSGVNKAVWATITRALRVGSFLEFLWTADNNTHVTDEADLHLDEVVLRATTGKHTDCWKIATEACRDNSARMIRRGTTPTR